MNSKNKILNENKLDDAVLDNVSGGTNTETISDGQVIKNMLGLKGNVNPGVIATKFAAAKVSVSFNSGGTGNVYMFNGRRISRYEALVHLVRANGHGNFDISPYFADTDGDNIINKD